MIDRTGPFAVLGCVLDALPLPLPLCGRNVMGVSPRDVVVPPWMLVEDDDDDVLAGRMKRGRTRTRVVRVMPAY